jgi:hypothetical protein
LWLQIVEWLWSLRLLWSLESVHSLLLRLLRMLLSTLGRLKTVLAQLLLLELQLLGEKLL